LSASDALGRPQTIGLGGRQLTGNSCFMLARRLAPLVRARSHCHEIGKVSRCGMPTPSERGGSPVSYLLSLSALFCMWNKIDTSRQPPVTHNTSRSCGVINITFWIWNTACNITDT
jgi:hypothetical protein